MEFNSIIPLMSVVVSSIACFTAISRNGRQDSSALTKQIATLMATLEFIKQQIADISRNNGDVTKAISGHTRELERLSVQQEVLRHDVDRAHEKIREVSKNER